MEEWIPYLAAAMICWAINPLFVKHGQEMGATAQTILVLDVTSRLFVTSALQYFNTAASAKMEGEKATEAVDAMHGNLSYTMGDLNYTNLVCFMGVSFSAVAYWFNLKALEKGEASVVVAVGSMYPVLTTILSVVLLGNSISMRKAAGLVLAISAGYLLGT